MARHTSSRKPGTTARRALIALATAGAALGAGAATASAAPLPLVDGADVPTAASSLTGSLPYLVAPLTGLKLNPLAGTGTDPLDNGIATQIADFRPLDSRALTRPLAEAESLGGIPVVGQVLGVLGG
ncbi:hypothetical protein [Streptomyces sp. NPDC047000]|uniref:hypothetical protein n=1 Tax=Streptomyces sp. NPDC047000 TaxID=3155474 RepID=UPI00340442D0